MAGDALEEEESKEEAETNAFKIELVNFLQPKGAVIKIAHSLP